MTSSRTRPDQFLSRVIRGSIHRYLSVHPNYGVLTHHWVTASLKDPANRRDVRTGRADRRYQYHQDPITLSWRDDLPFCRSHTPLRRSDRRQSGRTAHAELQSLCLLCLSGTNRESLRDCFLSRDYHRIDLEIILKNLVRGFVEYVRVDAPSHASTAELTIWEQTIT